MDLAALKLNEMLHKLSIWFNYNVLSLNLEKTICITFGNYIDSIPRVFIISIHCKAIKRVESTKYLGLVFEMLLKWNHHIIYLTNRMKYIIYTLDRLSKNLSEENILSIMYGLAWWSAGDNSS